MCQLLCCEMQKSECYGSAVFCKHELEKLKAATAACTVCCIEPFKMYPDVAVDREIKGLKRNKGVGCGCSWSGELD